MDEPKSLNLPTTIIPLSLTQFDESKQAFAELIKNNQSLLKNLIAQEQRGNYCPELYKAAKVIHARYHSGSEIFFNKMENLEAINLLLNISRKPEGYNKLISVFNNEMIYIGEVLVKCRKILVKNRYIVNTYGSYAPYQDRIITPLHYVLAKVGDSLWSQLKGIEYCKLLLSCGANPNAQDDFGNTPIYHACTPELIELLCSYGAEINTKGYYGRTPLLNNIRLGDLPLVKCLLQYSADPNKRDDKGNTPLTKAIAKKNPEIVRLLLECGADWSQEDGKNKGRLVGYTECLRVLRNHINIHIKDLLLKEFNLTTIKRIINSPCIYIIDTEMGNELMQWIIKACAQEFKYKNSGAYALYEYLYEKRKSLWGY
jgi:hypothetical protein